MGSSLYGEYLREQSGDSTNLYDQFLAEQHRNKPTGSGSDTALLDIPLPPPPPPARSKLALARIAQARGRVTDEGDLTESAPMTFLRSLGTGVSNVGSNLMRGVATIDEDLGESIGARPSKLSRVLSRGAQAIEGNTRLLAPSDESIGAHPWASAGGETAGEFAASSIPYEVAGIAANPLTRSIGRIAKTARAGKLGTIAEKTVGRLAQDETIGPLTRGRQTIEQGKTALRALPGHVAANLAPTAAMDPNENPLTAQTAGFSLLGALTESRTPRVDITSPLEQTGPRPTSIRKKLASIVDPTGATELQTANERRMDAERKLEVDDLTGAANRFAFKKALKTAEADPATSIVRFDVNGFKAVNDTHGHDAGDLALTEIPKSLTAAAVDVGAPGRIFRVGGDEFAAIVPTDLAEKFRDRAEELYGIRDHGEDVKTSISGGVGATDAEADAAAIARKQIHKTVQGIAGREPVVVPVGGATVTPPTPLEQLADKRGIGPSSRVFSHPVDELNLDPDRFQFKLDTNEKGVTRNLSSVEKFNPDLAGSIGVWKDPADGKYYVVNGHHRYDLAKRTGTKNIDVHYIEAADANEAMAAGALENIAEGQGTALDAAHFFRKTELGPETLKEQGVDLSGRIAKAGLALSKLEPDVFSKVATGKISEGHGAIIGRSLELPEMQRAAASLVENSPKKLTDSQVEELVNQVRSAGSEQVTQDNLFGTDTEGVSLVYHRADIAAEIKKRLAGDKKLFGYVAKGNRAAELERGGNRIDVETSGQIARQSAMLEEVFNKEAHAAGDVGRSITEAARRVANGESVRKVVDDIYDPIREAVQAAIPRGEKARSGERADTGTSGEPAAEGGAGGAEGAGNQEVVPPDPDQEQMFGAPRYPQKGTRRLPKNIERIKSAAYRSEDGTIHEGVTHYEARQNAKAAGDLDAPLHLDETADGFTTTKGRFVSRETAYDIAEAADQFKSNLEADGSPRLPYERLIAEDINGDGGDLFAAPDGSARPQLDVNAAGDLDLFGNRVSSGASDQTSMFGGKEGTEAARNLKQAEAAARSELDRLQHQIIRETDPKKKVAAARRIAELQKLVNRDQPISPEELATRIIAEKTTEHELGFEEGLFSPAPRKSAEAEARILKGTKVVDEKGKPMTVYHGTGVRFDEWGEPGDAVYGPGYYFAESPIHAGFYARSDGFGSASRDPNVRPTKLDIKNPFRADYEGSVPREEVERVIAIAKKTYGKEYSPEGHFFDADKAETGDELYIGLSAALGHSNEKANRVLQLAGYDGITFVMSVDPHEFGLEEHFPDMEPFDDRVWVAFKPAQIRSAGEPVPIDDEALHSPATTSGPLRRRVSKILGKDDAPDPVDVKALISISRNLAKAINPAVRQGRFLAAQRRALGVFFTKSEAIRVRRLDDVQTVAHEIGHYISKRYLSNPTMQRGTRGRAFTGGTHDLRVKLTSEAKAELNQMGHDLYGSRKPNAGYGEEGIAQYFAFYVADPGRLLVDAPKFHAIMESEIFPKEPALVAALDQAREDYGDYQKAPARARIDAMISVDESVRNRPSVRAIVAAMFDKLNEFKLAVDELGGERDPARNAYTVSRLTGGDAGFGEEMAERGVVEWKTNRRVTRGLEEILQEIPKKRIQAFRSYLVAEKALEKLGQGIDAGIKGEDARAVKAELEGEFGKPAAEIWAIRHALIDLRRDAGLLTDAEAETIKEKNKRSVGFYRVFDAEEARTKGSGSGGGFGRNSSGVFKMKGSARRIVDPLESMLNDIYNAAHQAHTHDVLQTLVAHARRTEGGGKIAEILTERPKHLVQIPIERAIKQLLDLGFEIPENMPDDKVQELAAGVLQDYQNNITGGPREAKDMIVPFVKDGERFWVQLKDRRLYDSIKGLDREQLPQWAKILSWPTKLLRAGATLTLEFMGRNPVRDSFDAAIYSQAGFKPPGFHFAKGIFSLLRKDAMYQEWRLAGGDNAAMLGLDRTSVQRSLKQMLRRGPGHLIDVVTHPVDMLRLASSITENATRLGEYKYVKADLLRRGMEEHSASVGGAFASRELTIDFNRSGWAGVHLNRIIAFFNANMQGSAKLVRELRNRPAEVIPRIAAAITIPSLALWYLQKDDPAYKEIPRWEKDLFWVWVERGADGKVEHIWRVPKPFEVGILFGSAPEHIAEWIHTRDPHAFDGLIKSIGSGMSPGALPTGILPLIENWANKSFFRDRPVVPRSTEKLDPAHQASRYSSETARQLGAIFNYPPAKIDNIIRGWTGGLGADYAVKGTDALIRGARRLAGKEPLSPPSSREGTLPGKLPGIRGFTIREPGYDAESVNQVYERFAAAEERRQTWKSLITAGRSTEAAQYFKSHREEIMSVVTKSDAGEAGPMRAAYAMIEKLQDMAHDLEDAKIPGEKRQEQLRRVYDAMIKVAENATAPKDRPKVAPDPVALELEDVGAKVDTKDPAVRKVTAATIASEEYRRIDEIAAQLVEKDPKYAGRSRSALARELKKGQIESAVAAMRPK